MDRKAWIVIVLCVLGMGVNFWYASQNEAARVAAARAQEAQRAAEAAKAPPVAPAAAATPPPAGAVTPATGAATAGAAPASTTTVTTVVEAKHSITKGSVTYEFTTKGGGIARVTLGGSDHVTLNQHGSEAIGALRREATGLDPVAYKIVEKTDHSVTFEGQSADGITVRKAYTLSSGELADDHLLGLTVTLANHGTVPHKSEEYYLYAGAAASLRPDEIRVPRFFWNDAGDAEFKDASHFAGGWFSDEKTEFRQSFSKLRYAGVMSRFYAHILSHASKEDRPGKIWAGRLLIDHSADEFKDMDKAKHDYAIQSSVGLPPVDLAPGASQSEQYEIYLGPKEYHRLRDLGGQRASVMFYGWFTPISQFLTNIMRWLHGWAGNWGVAIILLTLFVRTCIWPIHAKSQYTMKRMGLLGPKMKELQEKYKSDPQKQQAEVMKLYRDYGVNPLGGCLPMFLQLPIFFGFYSVLENAAELRGQSFLWVNDLSLPDTVYTILFPFSVPLMGYDFDINPLPLIMGVTMILQMKLTPQPATVDKMQQRIFMLMPFFFLFICYNFAAALSLYWSTQNIFSIFQTWIMKLYVPEPTLEKVERKKPVVAPANPFFSATPPGQKDKKGRKQPPKLGG